MVRQAPAASLPRGQFFRFLERCSVADSSALAAVTRLGMDPAAHRSLLWIAREALKEDLPPNWKLCQTPEKDPFYFNFVTAESSWEHPCDDAFKQLFASEKRKLQESGSTGGGTPRCDAIDALAESEQLEGCLRRAIQLDLCVTSRPCIAMDCGEQQAEFWFVRVCRRQDY